MFHEIYFLHQERNKIIVSLVLQFGGDLAKGEYFNHSHWVQNALFMKRGIQPTGRKSHVITGNHM